MKVKLLLTALALALASSLCFSPAAHAQAADQAQTVSACGTPNNTPVVGNVYAITQDTTAKLCTSSAGGVSPAPLGVTSTDASGTVTAGGTYQTLLAASATRKGCTFQNPTTATEVFNIKAGTMATPFTLSPGATFSCVIGGIVLTDVITGTAATTTHAFAGTSQ